MDLKEKTVKGIKWSAINIFAVNLLNFLAVLVLARLLGPTAFGQKNILLIITGFGRQFADMGMGAAIIHYQEIEKKQLSSLFWLNFGLGIIITLIIFFGSGLIGSLFGETEIVQYIRVLSIIFLIVGCENIFKKLLQKEMEFNKIAYFEIIKSSMDAGFTIVLILMGYGLWGFVYGKIISTIIHFILLVFSFRNVWIPGFYFNYKGIKPFLSFGFFQLGQRIINYFKQNIDYIIISRLLGAEVLGFYSLAYQLVTVPQKKINPIINRVIFPAYSKIQKNIPLLKKAFSLTLKYICIVSFPLLTGLMLVSSNFIEVFYGMEWEDSILLIQILAIVGLLKTIGNPIGSVMLARGRADMGFYYNLFSGILVTFVTLITARYNIFLVAWGLLGLQGFVFFPIGFYFRKILLGMTPVEFFQIVKVPTISALIMCLIVFFSGVFWEDQVLISLIFRICIGAITYVGVYYFLDRKIFKDIKEILF